MHDIISHPQESPSHFENQTLLHPHKSGTSGARSACTQDVQGCHVIECDRHLDDKDVNECAICLEAFSPGCKVRRLCDAERIWGECGAVLTPCEHVFHLECFLRQLDASQNGNLQCALCRTK